MYHNADISLIDDALSAVDAHVAKHLFERCVCEELMNCKSGRKRSVVLVTNALQFLKHSRVDKIVVINDGRIAEQGSYKQLASVSDSLFARFLAVIEETGIKAGDTVDDELDESGEGINDSLTHSRRSERHASVRSSDGNHAAEEKKTNLMTEESRSIGHVGLDVYLAWAKAAGGYWVPFALIFLFGAVEGINVTAKWWITYWSSHASSGSQMGFLVSTGISELSELMVCFTMLLTDQFLICRIP